MILHLQMRTNPEFSLSGITVFSAHHIGDFIAGPAQPARGNK